MKRTSTRQAVAPPDPLSELLALLKPDAIFSKQIDGKGMWGVGYDRIDVPGFCIVLEGRCVVNTGDSPPINLEAGDFVLFTQPSALEVRSGPNAECTPSSQTTMIQRYGAPEGVPDFRMLAGAFHVSSDHEAILQDLLPSLVHIPASNSDNGRIAQLIGMIVQECLDRRPGHHDAMKRLMEVSLIMIARWLGSTDDLPRAGLLAGLKDARVAAAIGAMHGDVRHGWTVAGLASVAGMSRSAFAARFSEAVGCGPLEYLAGWRMLLAREELLQTGMTLEEVAGSIGFQSASAFSTAFRKRYRCSPSAYRSRQGPAPSRAGNGRHARLSVPE